MKQIRIFNFLIIVFLFSSSFSILFSQEKMTLEKLTKQADLIIIGEVKEINSQWNHDKTKIWSFISVDVEENIKGINDEVIIRVLGGEVDGIGMAVSGTPEFSLSERFLGFLQKDTDSTFTVTGWKTGKYLFKNGFWENNFSKYSNSLIDDLRLNVTNWSK